MNGWVAEDIRKDNLEQTVGAAASALVVSNPSRTTYGGATCALRIDIVGGVVVGGGSRFQLQTSSGVDGAGAESWVDVTGKLADLTVTNSVVSIALHNSVLADAALLPLRPRLRLVATNIAGGTSIVKNIRLMQEQ
jgi:hypothetical protein